MKKLRLLILLMVLCLSITACTTPMPEELPAEPQVDHTQQNPESLPEEPSAEDIVILYTNDIHTFIDKPISYDVIAGVKAELQQQYGNVLLVDAGDHIQGAAYGAMDKGETIISMMNAAGYDLATLGNHEFDYNMEGCMNVLEWADYPYVSCNFHHLVNGAEGQTVLPSYQMFTFGERTIAIVGITTPEAFRNSSPAYFQDENGNFIYSISGGEDGKKLYADVQKAIDDARAEGAEMVIALGHLGDDLSASPWTSEQTIANVSGLDAFIDGHSHTMMAGKEVADREGRSVLLTQTGDYFERIGMMVIDGETGEITTDFIEYEEILEPMVDEAGNPVLNENGEQESEIVGYRLVSALYNGTSWCSDEAVASMKTAWIESVDSQLETVVGKVNVNLVSCDDAGNRVVRMQETNCGNFCADALYYLFDQMEMDVDIAVMNGGGIRNKTGVTGDFSYKTAKEIHTFGNIACLQTVTGQQILDALEWGARVAGNGEECGGFLQVAGLTYEINTQWADSTQKDEQGIWIGAPTGGYRVQNVKVYDKESNTYVPLELDANYNLAGHNYTLRDLGDGFNMFSGAVNVLDYVMEDYMVLANYVQGFENGTVDGTNSPLLEKYPAMLLDYSDANGCGRISLIK